MTITAKYPEREIKYTALPELDNGEIWATQREGIFVVVSQCRANWRGEDRDVYSHIDTWYTVRDASDAEQELWNNAVHAASDRKQLRTRLNAVKSYSFDPVSRTLTPSASATRMLDSYDDRWQPPAAIHLTDEEYDIEQAYVDARAALKGH